MVWGTCAQQGWIPLQNLQLRGFLSPVLLNLCLVASRDTAWSPRRHCFCHLLGVDTDLQMSAPAKARLTSLPWPGVGGVAGATVEVLELSSEQGYAQPFFSPVVYQLLRAATLLPLFSFSLPQGSQCLVCCPQPLRGFRWVAGEPVVARVPFPQQNRGAWRD